MRAAEHDASAISSSNPPLASIRRSHARQTHPSHPRPGRPSRGLAASIEKKGAVWNAHKGSLRKANRKSADLTLVQAAETSLVGYTALDAWDVNCYPHQQTLWDIQNMDAALAALAADPVDPAAAAEAVTAVSANWLGTVFSPSVYLYDLTRHDPDYYRVTWGALGRQVDQFDMTPVTAWIGDGQYDRAIAKIEQMRGVDTGDLGTRVVNMTNALDQATSIMKKAM